MNILLQGLIEIVKPMYSTCLGFDIKGYNDYENKHKQFELQYTK